MVVQHNLTAFNTNRMLGLTNSSLAKSTEKLSSGYKVNRAADDAAGLAISEKMRRQIRGLTQASANCQDGVSLCQIADGALNEVHDMLKRCEELAVKAANDTNTAEDREYIQMELDALASEIDRVHQTTVFNNQNIFSDNGITPSDKTNNLFGIENGKVTSDGTFSFMTDNGIYVEVGFVASDASHILNIADTSQVGEDNSDTVKNSSLAAFAQTAAANAVNLLSQKYPQTFINAVSGGIKVGLELRNDKAGGTLATASMQISSNGTSTLMSYNLFIDTADYPISDFDSFTDDKKADLAAVIAHEMTHLMMYDTSTDGMLNGRTTSFPEWFVEGIAQTSSGDNGWMSHYLDTSSSETDIKNYLSQLYTMPYGAGYVATMYLGMAAFQTSQGRSIDDIVLADVKSESIAKGLDIVLSSFVPHKDADGKVSKKTLDDIIKEYTDFDGLADFEQKFRSGSASAVNFTDLLLDVRGNSGAGSILYNLNETESSAYKPDTLITSYGSYDTFKVQTDNKYYANAYGSGYTFPEKGSIKGGGGQGGGNGNGFLLQVGAESGQYIHVDQFNISASALLGGHTMDVTGEYRNPSDNSPAAANTNGTLIGSGDAASRENTIEIIKEADRRVSLIRSYYGATQNRLEHTIKNLDNIVENTTAAESMIRDTDMAKEMVHYSNSNILSQAAQTMLAQANQSKQGILSLLQ